MDFRTVFAELDAARAAGIISRYALGGAVAATFYIEPAATEDIDVFVARGARVDGEHLVIGSWPVQFLPATSPLQSDALDAARSIDVEGQLVPVLSAEHLAAIALDTSRLKDKVRLQQFLEWKGFDRDRFVSLVGKHALGAKWARYQAQFLNESP